MNKLLFKATLLGIVAVLLFAQTSDAQRRRKRGPLNEFMQTQWWLGFKGGVNLTQVQPETRYSSFSAINNSDPNFYDKEYDDFSQLGANAGLEITFFHKGLSISFQPNYRRQNFLYSNNYLWVDADNPINTLELNYQQTHQLDYLEFPLLFKYDFTRSNFRPFVSIGAYYATLINANKSVEISGVDQASGAANPFSSEPIIVGASDLFLNSSLGLIGGVGCNWDLGNVRLSLDVNYRYGLHNISSAGNRYEDNRLAGAGDALDDLTMNNISISLACLFPLRFIFGGGYRAVD